MADVWPDLVRRLVELEDTLPYVTIETLLERSPAGAELTPTINAAIADGRLFTDRRQRFDAATSQVTPVRLVRLNRRHPEVAALLDPDQDG